MNIGVIQGIEINDEGKKETVWFVQERARNISLVELKKRGFKIAQSLVDNGFSVQDVKAFDQALVSLLKQKQIISQSHEIRW